MLHNIVRNVPYFVGMQLQVVKNIAQNFNKSQLCTVLVDMELTNVSINLDTF